MVVDYICLRNYDGRDIKIKNLRVKLMDSDPDYDFVLPPYTEPFTGLKHVEFSGVRSTGKNIFNQEKLLNGNWTKATFNNNDCFMSNTYNGTIYPCYISKGMTAKLSFYWAFENGIDMYAYVHYKDGTSAYLTGNTITGYKDFSRVTASINATQDVVGITFRSYGNKTVYLKDIMINLGSTILPYEPYKEAVVKYDSPLKLGKWDYVEDGKIYEGSKTLVFNGKDELKFGTWMYDGPSPSDPITCWYFGFTDNTLKAQFYSLNNSSNTICDKYSFYNSDMYSSSTPDKVYQTSYYDSGSTISCNFVVKDRSYSTLNDFLASLSEKPMTIRFKLKTAIYNGNNINKLDQYPAYEGGTEQLLINSEQYGFNPSIDVVYKIQENPTEAATKGYVNNGLAKKLDTSGGLIQGSLQVDGTIQGKLSSIVVTNGETTYGLAYDSGDDTFKLGQGSYSDSEKVFEFKEGEGLPIALRDDDSKLPDNSLLKYSKDGNKLTDSGVKLDLLLKLFDSLTLEQVEALNEFAKSLTLID